MSNLGHLPEGVARIRPHASAVIAADGTSLDFQSLAARARSLARYFETCGLRPGDRIGVAMTNHPAFFEVLTGAWQAGIIVAPMNPRLHPREFVSLMADCGARLCVATPDLAPPIAAVDPLIPQLVIDSRSYVEARDNPSAEAPRAPGGNAPAWLFYTSGTTGKPKGATLTHANLRAMIDSFLVDSGCAVDDAMLHTAPLSHAGGLLGLAFLERGLPQVVMPTGAMDSEALAQALQVWPRSSFFAVPTLVNRMTDPGFLPQQLHGRIAKIMFGGAPMYAQDLRRAIAAFGADRLWGGYGQGEAPCTIAHLPSALLGNPAPHDPSELFGSVGLPRSGVEIRILDDAGADVSTGALGEVAVRGAVVMTGYWNRPDATAETLVDGWLHTGDIGRIGPTGLLTLVDRSKDMIISGGSNIYPREIEEVLLQHPLVREAAVVGMPDAEWGELPFAFVVTASAVSDDELDAFCLSQIARYKRPRGYRAVEALPKSSYGKILKSELRSLLLAPPSRATLENT
jgi:acyl-CoA synthetase (AMP-forming)/AMP-acid ligase II